MKKVRYFLTFYLYFGERFPLYVIIPADFRNLITSFFDDVTFFATFFNNFSLSFILVNIKLQPILITERIDSLLNMNHPGIIILLGIINVPVPVSVSLPYPTSQILQFCTVLDEFFHQFGFQYVSDKID